MILNYSNVKDECTITTVEKARNKLCRERWRWMCEHRFVSSKEKVREKKKCHRGGCKHKRLNEILPEKAAIKKEDSIKTDEDDGFDAFAIVICKPRNNGRRKGVNHAWRWNDLPKGQRPGL
jgi:hypothetical protein